MSRIKKIIVRIQSLRKDIDHSDRVATLRRYIGVISEVDSDLASTLRAAQHSKQVFPRISLNKADTSIRRAADASRQLHRGLSKDPESVDSAKTETSVSNIKEAAKSAITEVRTQWASLVTTKVNTYSSLADAANEAKLGGRDKLQRTLGDLLSKAQSPPLNDTEAIATSSLLQQLADNVRDLGLEGDAGKFLELAASGQGDPKWLEKPEVRAMLDKHNLWRVLRVTLH